MNQSANGDSSCQYAIQIRYRGCIPNFPCDSRVWINSDISCCDSPVRRILQNLVHVRAIMSVPSGERVPVPSYIKCSCVSLAFLLFSVIQFPPVLSNISVSDSFVDGCRDCFKNVNRIGVAYPILTIFLLVCPDTK